MRFIVTHDFDGRTRGEVLTDAAEIAAIQASGHADHIVAAADDAAPAPAQTFRDETSSAPVIDDGNPGDSANRLS